MIHSFLNFIQNDVPYEIWFIFPLELILAEFIFAGWMPRRSRWGCRAAVGILVLGVVSLLWPAIGSRAAFLGMLQYLVLFLIAVGFVYYTFDCRLQTALFCSIAAYILQHLGNTLATLLMYSLPAVLFGSHYYFGGWYHFVMYLASFGLSYLIIYLIFGQKLRREGFHGADSSSFTAFMILVLLLIIVLNYIHAYFVPWENNGIAHLLLNLYTMAICVFSLFIQLGMHRQTKLEESLEITRQLIRSQEKQFHISEDTINTINLKCHDLKHQVKALRRQIDDPASRAALKELESAVMIYDSAVKTGHPALDVILTEKSLLCEHDNIQLTCMIDAAGLEGIRDTDLYSIFGNLMDNAIESVKELPDSSMRTIGLNVCSRDGMVVIHTENYFDHPITMEEGLPLTTKEDTRYHGYGMKSLQLLAEHYGGGMNLNPDGNVFNVDIILPRQK